MARSFSFLEPLEERIAPAGLIDGAMTIQSPTTGTFVDADGDSVTVTFNKNIFSQNFSLLQSAFVFTASPGDATKFSLTSLDLSKLQLGSSGIDGLNISVVAEPAGGGDGLVNVGEILGNDYELQSVTVDGALGKIVAGRGYPGSTALGSLWVDSLGLAGDEPADFAAITSTLRGSIGTVYVAHDIDKAFIRVEGGESTIASLHVGGSLIGGTNVYSGSVLSYGSLGTVVIGGNLQGGSGQNSGMLRTVAGMNSVTVGSLIGGEGIGSGSIRSGTSLDTLHVQEDIIGSWAEWSGSVRAKTAGSLTVDGNLHGHVGNQSGAVQIETKLDSLILKGDVLGSLGMYSGTVTSPQILTAKVDGGLFGSSGYASGVVWSTSGGMAVLKSGSQNPGTGSLSGVFRGETVDVPIVLSGYGVSDEDALTILDARTVSYTDADGDIVTILFSKDIFTPSADTPENAFMFLPAPGDPTKFSLSRIYLPGLSNTPGSLSGLDITITAEQAGGGDGRANVGHIDFANFDLGTVKIDGALGRITAGDNNLSTPGLAGLEVDSLGLADGSELPDFRRLTSEIKGSVGHLEILHDLNKACFLVEGAGAGIASIHVGGNLIGGLNENSGSIHADGALGTVLIDGDLLGGFGSASARLSTDVDAGSISVGSLIGGEGASSASISANRFGVVAVAGDLIGGTGHSSALLYSRAGAESITISGSMIGGSSGWSGSINAGTVLESLTIIGDLTGGSGNYSGTAYAEDIVTASTGDLYGGSGVSSGSVISTRGGLSLLSHGTQNPGSGTNSGIFLGEIPDLPLTPGDGIAAAAVTVIDAMTGTFIDADGDLVTMTFNRAVFGPGSVALDHAFVFVPQTGSPGQYTLSTIDVTKLGLSVADLTGLSLSLIAGQSDGGDGLVNVSAILATGIDLDTVTVDGVLSSIVAGDHDLSTSGLKSLVVDSLGVADANAPMYVSAPDSAIRGSLDNLDILHNLNRAFFQVYGAGSTIANVHVGGDIIGGIGRYGGAIYSQGTMGTVLVEGDLRGGIGPYSGSIFAQGKIESVTVNNIIGGGLSEFAGAISAGGIGSLLVKGDLKGGIGVSSGSIKSDADVGSITVQGRLIGAATEYSGAIYVPARIDHLEIQGGTQGGAGEYSGAVHAFSIGTATVPGDLHGGSSYYSGSIVSQTRGMEVLVHGEQYRGEGYNSGIFEGETTNIPSDAGALTIRNATSATYIDADGDKVTIQFNKKIFAQLDPATLNAVFDFRGGGGRFSLAYIDFTKISDLASLQGLTVSITAQKTVGDGSVDVGAILGAGIDFGNVTVEGALGKFVAGDADQSDYALRTLRVNQLGLFSEFPSDVASVVAGHVRALRVDGDVYYANFRVEGESSILHSLRVGNIWGGDSANSGTIYAEGGMRNVVVQGMLAGNRGLGSGTLATEKKIESVRVGEILGGAGNESGTIVAHDLGRVTIDSDITGGTGTRSGSIHATGDIGTITLRGNILGGAGERSGSVIADHGIRSVTLRGDLHGGAGLASGSIAAAGLLKALRAVNADLFGATGELSGTIASGESGMRVSGRVFEHPGTGVNSGVVVA